MANESSPMVPGTSAAPLSWSALQVALPTGMYVERRDGMLIIESDRRNTRLVVVALMLAVIADVAFILALRWVFSVLLDAGTLDQTAMAAAGVGAAAVPLTLFALARAFNTHRLVIGGGWLTSTSEPVPWFGDRHALEVARLKRFFVSRSSNAVLGRPSSALWWESDTGRRRILVDDLPDDAIAGLLEEAMEEHLGLDGPGRPTSSRKSA